MFGHRLRELRILNNYTQATLAYKIGVSEKTIGTWERGTREPPMETTVKLANIFNVTLDYLYGRNETPEWATQKDSIDLKSFLDGNMNPNMNYDGEDLTTEQNERLKLAMTQIFWEERQKDKKRAENHGDDKGIK